jgi:uncharacterized protein
MKPLIAYHKNCLDGFGGAWAAWKVFGADADYIGLEHHIPPPDSISGREVYFIDFCYQLEIMQGIFDSNESVIVLDHHATRENVTRCAQEFRYALDHSGSILSWNYFHPDTPAPYLLRVIEDNDLYHHALPDVRELIQIVALAPFDFETWSSLAQSIEDVQARKTYIRDGALLLSARDKAVDVLLQGAEPVVFEGHHIFAVNTPRLYSETANAMYEQLGCAFGLTWYYQDGWIHVSLRSDGTCDVSQIAKKYNGGGHRGASGFSLPCTWDMPWHRDGARSNPLSEQEKLPVQV